jgi:hypothetical protein
LAVVDRSILTSAVAKFGDVQVEPDLIRPAEAKS